MSSAESTPTEVVVEVVPDVVPAEDAVVADGEEVGAVEKASGPTMLTGSVGGGGRTMFSPATGKFPK